MVIVIMGAEAASRIATGRALASELAWPFLDADTVHPAPAVSSRPAATPPSGGADRTAWAAAVHAIAARTIGRREHIVMTCGPAAARDRDILKAGLTNVRIVSLDRRPGAPALPGVSDMLAVDAATPQALVLAAIRREFGLA